MIIPYATDAPIYHFPKATLGMVAVNVGIHALWWSLPPETAEPYAMKLGAGLHPLQWLTHNFLHADLLHLVGNMIFLWSYGIIVEGKIGWLPFSLSYLGIGTLHGALIQAAYLRAEEPSYVLGASAIIFGLMAVAMIWAPVNELSCFYFFLVGFRAITNVVEWPIYVFALLQLTLEGIAVLFQYLVHGDPMSSGLLHISGAFWGLVVGILLVQARWVDCEGWDVFSLLSKRRALRAAWKAREAHLDRIKENDKPPRTLDGDGPADRPDVPQKERAALLLQKVHRAIERNEVDAAEAVFKKWMAATSDRPTHAELVGVVKALHAKKSWIASIPAMRALCRLYPDKADNIRLKLAFILIRFLERPTEAKRHLERIAVDRLDPQLRRHRLDLIQEADRMIEEGVLELEDDA